MSNFYTEVPADIPPELVRHFPLSVRETIYENPFETLIPEIHRGPPAFMAPKGYLSVAPGWVFRRAKDMRKIFADTTHFKKQGNTNFAATIGDDWSLIPSELDPPRHTAVRRALMPLFSPESVGAFDGKVKQRARECIATFKDRGGCDFTRDFAVPYPVSIFLDLLGLPHERMHEFLEWEHALIQGATLEDRGVGVRAVKAYLLDAIEERRRHPAGDLISTALSLRVNDVPLSPMEVFGHCFNLFLGGLDTVSANISLHFMHLATHPEDQQWLRDNPDKVATDGMAELVRAYAAVSVFRICEREIEMAGVTVKPGDKVVLATALAARDPEQYADPDTIRFDRQESTITFGWGAHRCLGVLLAQREIHYALQEMLAAIPTFRLAEGFRIPFRIGSVIQTPSLEIVWN